MRDYGSKITDEAVAKSLRKIRRVYAIAEKDLRKKFEAFLAKHRVQGTIMMEKLKNGEITPAAYHSWMRGQVFIGKRWDQKIKTAVNIF